MKPKISLVTLGVADFKAAKAFYEGLGFPVAATDGEDFAMFKLEGSWLGLFPKDKLAEDAGVKSDGRGFPGFSLAHNVASKEKVDAVVEEARRLGAEVTKKPQDTFWGGYSGYFRAPDGFYWEVAWNPHTDLT
ncbi:MAG: VOC family protein [Elusimicrobia bacterium]|nr:VOC family protein [Elusimicrobiota bacterium]